MVGSGGPSCPKPSIVSTGGRAPSAAPSVATPWLSVTIRRNSSTNRPESGRFDQSLLADVWTSTTRPLPRRAAVTSGVPSVSRAQVLSPRSSDGSARTWRWIKTSPGISIPAKGLAVSKGARRAGSSQVSAPLRLRLPPRKRTGINGSAPCNGVVPLPSARRGPAKRSNRPPRSIQSRSCARSASGRMPMSGRTRTARSRRSRSAIAPRRSSVKGSSARCK